MPKILATILLVAAIAATNASAAEKKLVVIGGVDFAFKSLTLDVGGKMTAPQSTINPNLILSYGNLYTSLSYDGAVGSGSVVTIENGNPGTLDMSRSDFLFTVGYRLIDPVNVFAGWLNGNIHAVQTGVRDLDGGGPNPAEWYVQDIKYDTQGPFLGASWSMALGQRSSLSFSAAYAKLAGTINDATTSFLTGTTPSSDSFDVAGLSYGITFSGELTGSLGYRMGIKNTRYKGAPTTSTPGGIVEQYTSFFFGVSNYF